MPTLAHACDLCHVDSGSSPCQFGPHANANSGQIPIEFFFGLPTQAFFKDVTDKATEFQHDGYLEFKAKWCAAEADHGGEHGDTTAEADCVGSFEVPDTVGQSHSVGWQMQKQGFRPSAIPSSCVK